MHGKRLGPGALVTLWQSGFLRLDAGARSFLGKLSLLAGALLGCKNISSK